MDHGSIDRGLEAQVDMVTRRPTGFSPLPWAEEAVNLSALWTELITGSCKVEQILFPGEACTVVVRREKMSSSEPRAGLSRRDIEVLEQSLLAGVRKSVAADHQLCASSIADILRRCFSFMGLSCWPSRIPLLLVIAAHAKHAEESPLPANWVMAQNQRLFRQRIGASRPDLELASELSAAEYGVTRLLVEGKSYAEIADLRQTSRRTVANQVASAFHRLDISGRSELLCLLAKRQVATWQAERVRPVSGRARALADESGARSLARVAG